MKLSIITINYNNAEGLQNTIASVISQSWKDFEYIIIDGGSADNSVNIIKQNKEHLAYWQSEPDKGIYNAMNIGISKAKGDYLLMLNSGDALANDQVLSSVFEKNSFDADILYGNVVWLNGEKVFLQTEYPDVLSFEFFWKKTLGHQSTFIRRSLHNSVGLYDESLQFISDWKFFILAICKHDATYKFVNKTISACDCNGLSWRPSNFAVMKAERDLILKESFPLFYNDYKELEQLKTNTFRNKLIEINQTLKGKIKSILFKK